MFGSTLKGVTALIVGGLVIATNVLARDFPTKPIQLIVPNAAGGATDVMARRVAGHMSDFLGTAVIVENVTGAGGNIAAGRVAQAVPDGHTLFFSTQIIVSNISLYQNISYDPINSFSPVSMLVNFGYVLVVNPDFPAEDIAALLQLLRDNPGRYSYASGGTGTSMHFTGELFNSLTGADMGHIPYRGETPAIADVLANHVPMVFATVPSAMPHLEAGTLRALAVSSEKRSARLPDVPALSEALPTFAMPPSWFSIVAPAGTPTSVVQKLNAAALKAMEAPDVIEYVNFLGGEVVTTTPDEFSAFIKTEIPRYAELVRVSGARQD